MKKVFVILILSICAQFVNAQHKLKKVIDYQYYRDDNKYYAFEIFKDRNATITKEAKLNFTWKGQQETLDNVVLSVENQERKIDYRIRKELIGTDNKEFNNIALIFNYESLLKITNCNAQLLFKLKSGLIYKLPFDICAFKSSVATN